MCMQSVVNELNDAQPPAWPFKDSTASAMKDSLYVSNGGVSSSWRTKGTTLSHAKSTRWCRNRRCANIKQRCVHRTRGKWKRTRKVGFWPQCWRKERSKAWNFVTTRAAIDAQLPWRGQQKRLWIYWTIYCRCTHWACKQSTCWTIPYNTMHCSLWPTLLTGKHCHNNCLKCLPVVRLFEFVYGDLTAGSIGMWGGLLEKTSLFTHITDDYLSKYLWICLYFLKAPIVIPRYWVNYLARFDLIVVFMKHLRGIFKISS